MSQHASLKVSSVGVKHRNVLKRHERIKKLQENEKWQERTSVLGLPKVKSMKIKVRKAKSEKVAGEEKPGTAAGQAVPAAAAQPVKAAVPAKTAAAPKKPK